MTLVQKKPPSTTVEQQFTEETATQVTPMLLSCIVGPCYTVIKALEDGSPNSEALVTLPGLAISQLPSTYVGIGGTTLSIKYKGYTPVDIDFPITASDLTADQVVEVIQNTTALTGITAKKITIGSSDYVVFYTTGTGQDEYFSFVAPSGSDASSILGLTLNRKYHSNPQYSQIQTEIPEFKFPDPLNILSEVEVDEDSVRVFLQGSELTEAKSDETLLSEYDTVQVVGNVDLTGLSYPDDVIDKVLEMTKYPEDEKTLSLFSSFRADIIDSYNEVAAFFEAHRVSTTYHFATDGDNALSYPSLSANAPIATIVSAWTDFQTKYNQHDANSGAGYHTGGSSHQDITALPTDWASMVAFYNGIKAIYNAHVGDVTGTPSYHNAADTNVMSYTLATVDQTDLIADINGTWSSIAELQPTTNYLLLSSSNGGINIGDGDVNTILGLTNDYEYVLEAVNDGDGDNNTPLLRVFDADFSASPTTATVTGSVALNTLSLPDDVFEKTVILGDERGNQTITFYEDLKQETVVLLNELLENYGEHISDLTYHISEDTTNVTASSGVTMANSLAELIAAANDLVTNYDDHDADVSPTWHQAAGGSNQITAPAATDLASLITLLEDIKSELGAHVQDVSGTPTFHKQVDTDNIPVEDTPTYGTYQTDIVDLINENMGAGFVSLDSSSNMVLTSSLMGYESFIYIGSGSANTDLGLTSGYMFGTPYKPIAGDQIWASGTLVGIIIEVAPNGFTNRVRIDREVAITYKDNNVYLKALNLTYGETGRPTPDLYNDGYVYYVKHHILRDGHGKQLTDVIANMLVSYKGLRLDVTAAAENPSLLMFSSTTEIEETLPPISTDNPLALGLYYAKSAAPNSFVSGIGVSEISADSPEGTLSGYIEAFEYIENFGVYGIVPLTHSDLVHKSAHTYISAARDDDKERILLATPDHPSKAEDTIVGSGTDGESTSTLNDFNTKLSDLRTKLVQEGLNPDSLTIDDGVYLSVGSDSNRYNISSVDGAVVSIRVSFPTGNDDEYFTEENLPLTLAQENFGIYVKGADTASQLDEAGAYYNKGMSYGDRAVQMIVCPEADTSIDGLDVVVPGYYATAALAGLISRINPSQPMNNMAIPGFTKARKVYPYFKDKYLNHIAAGGGMVLYTPQSSSSVVIRHSLTTDVSSEEKECPNVTRALDFSALYLRSIMRTFAGTRIINEDMMNDLGMLVQGGIEYLVEKAKVLLAADPATPQRAPGTKLGLRLRIPVTVGMPGNYIKLILEV